MDVLSNILNKAYQMRIKPFILTSLSFMLCLLSLHAQEKAFFIKGNISGLKAGDKIFLTYNYNKKTVKDSFVLSDATFEFKGNIENPVKASISAPSTEKSNNSKAFYIEPNQTTSISAVETFKNSKIEGGTVQSDYNLLTVMLKDHDDKYEKLVEEFMKLRETNDDAGIKNLDPKFEKLDIEKKAIIKKYIKEKPSSFVSFTSVSELAYMIDNDFLELFDLLSPTYKDTPKAKELVIQMEKAKKTFVGQILPKFSQKDTTGNEFSVKALSGKYLLIDFWASWCGPCRRENPNIVKAYQTYKDKNFEILGVSLDSKKESWINAIKKDALTWYHVSDLKGWKNEVSDMFGIKSIPQNLLINPEGIIIARNITGSELEGVLDKFLNTK
jgi:peroxiredoxin